MTGSRSSTGPRASIRVRAALAGGLVLGVAAGLTTASWVRAEYTGVTFATSAFDVQTNVQGAGYSTATTVAVSASGIYPSATLTSGNQYVSLMVRTLAGSVKGDVSLSATGNAGGGLTPVLRYRIVTIAAAATCSATSFTGSPTYVVGGPAAFQNVSAALASSGTTSLLANAGSEVQYCIELSVPPATPQGTYAGTSGVLTLLVTGTST